MKYKIFELVKPEHLQKTEIYGYYNILQEMDYSSKLDELYNSPEEALSKIEENKEDLKFKTLTIIPIIEINWEGEIR